MAFKESINHYVSKIRAHSNVFKELDPIWNEFNSPHNVVDLGCGNGHFLQGYIQARPEMRGLGVEKRFKRIFKTAQKLKSTDSKVIHYDVHEFLAECPTEFWSEVWMQFPDPWPKSRHEKHRMVIPLLFSEIYRVLKPGGRFCFRSDHESYWSFFQSENQKRKLFAMMRAQSGDLFTDAPPTLFQTIFTSKGIPIYSLEFRK
jgi:tRNA (guanine-N7-)-methyltransferase